jgi:hypothetical protein
MRFVWCAILTLNVLASGGLVCVMWGTWYLCHLSECLLYARGMHLCLVFTNVVLVTKFIHLSIFLLRGVL